MCKSIIFELEGVFFYTPKSRQKGALSHVSFGGTGDGKKTKINKGSLKMGKYIQTGLHLPFEFNISPRYNIAKREQKHSQVFCFCEVCCDVSTRVSTMTIPPEEQ